MNNLIYEPPKGESFRNAVDNLKKKLQTTGGSYRQILFNEIYVTVSSDSNVDDICTIYDLKHEMRRVKKKIDESFGW
jgi:hypothetical protein